MWIYLNWNVFHPAVEMEEYSQTFYLNNKSFQTVAEARRVVEKGTWEGNGAGEILWRMEKDVIVTHTRVALNLRVFLASKRNAFTVDFQQKDWRRGASEDIRISRFLLTVVRWMLMFSVKQEAAWWFEIIPSMVNLGGISWKPPAIFLYLNLCLWAHIVSG